MLRNWLRWRRLTPGFPFSSNHPHPTLPKTVLSKKGQNLFLSVSPIPSVSPPYFTVSPLTATYEYDIKILLRFCWYLPFLQPAQEGCLNGPVVFRYPPSRIKDRSFDRWPHICVIRFPQIISLRAAYGRVLIRLILGLVSFFTISFSKDRRGVSDFRQDREY